MKNLNTIVEELIEEIDSIEIEYYMSAYDSYINETIHTNTFGEIPMFVEGIQIDESIFEEQRKENLFLLEQISRTVVNWRAGNIETAKALNFITIAPLPQDILHNNANPKFLEIKERLTLKAFDINKLLNEPNKRLQRLEELQYIENISVEDFTLLYKASNETQRGYRSRSDKRRRIPFNGGGRGKDVFYVKSEVDEWIKKGFR